MKRPTKPNDEERLQRRKATRQLTMRYLALKESQRDVVDMQVEEHAEDIMEEVRQRLEQLAKTSDEQAATATRIGGHASEYANTQDAEDATRKED